MLQWSPHFQVTDPHMCSQHQSAPWLPLSLHCAYSELRNPFHLSLPLHGTSIILITLLCRDLIWVLKGPSPAWVQFFSVPLHQRQRSFFGPHVWKAPLCRSKFFLLASSYCAQAAQSTSSLPLREHAAVGQTAKEMERQLAAAFEYSGLRRLNLLSSDGCGCFQEQVSDKAPGLMSFKDKHHLGTV